MPNESYSDYVARRLAGTAVAFSGSLPDLVTQSAVRDVLRKSGDARSIATTGPDILFGDAKGRGEGTAGFDVPQDCVRSGEYMNSPWCVQTLLDEFNTAVARTEDDVRRQLREQPEKAQADNVKRWAKIYEDWKADKNVLEAQLMTAKQNSEWKEGVPDDPDEDASPVRLRLEQWLEKTKDIRNALKDIGIPLRPPQETPSEREERIGKTPASPNENITRNIAIAAVAVAGIYAVSAFAKLIPSKSPSA